MKPKHKRRYLIALAILATTACCLYPHMKPDPCLAEIPITISEEATNALIRKVSTPEQAINQIASDISFSRDHDPKILHCADRMTNLSETYSLGSGDCEDGAKAFVDLLRDDFQYEAKVLFIYPDLRAALAAGMTLDMIKQGGHAIAIYQDLRKGLWGYASFNDSRCNPSRVCTDKGFSTKTETINNFIKGLNTAAPVFATEHHINGPHPNVALASPSS